MTTLEHLFKQIFDRKKWIEGQLRQQEESFSQSAAYNLLATGLKPPGWLFEGGSEASVCSDTKEFSREKTISEILFQPGLATTPSTNHHTLYSLSLPTFKNTTISLLNIFSSQLCAQNEQVRSEHIGSDTQPEAAASNLAFESSIQFDPPATIQRSRSRQRDLEKRMTENEVAPNIQGENAQVQLQEYICHTGEVPLNSEVAHLGENLELNAKNTAGLESQTPLVQSVTTHSSAETLKSVGSNLSHINNHGEAFGGLVASRSRDVTANFHQEGSPNGIEKDNKVAYIGFHKRSLSNTSKQILSISSFANNISLVSSEVGMYQSSERLKEKQTWNAAVPDGPASQNIPLESGYFLRSSGSHMKSISTPFKSNTRSSSNTSKQNLSHSSSAKNNISLESSKVDIYQSSERLKEKQTWNAAVPDGPASKNIPLESGYFLRSSGSHRKSISTPFKSNRRSSSNISKQNLSHSSSAKNNISFESIKVDIYQSSERLKEKQTSNVAKPDSPASHKAPLESGYFIRNSDSHKKTVTTSFKSNTRSSSSNTSKQNLFTSSSANNSISLEFSKVDINQSSERLKEKQTLNAEKPDGPASQNTPLESGYCLRSSGSHKKSITTFNSNSGSLKRPLQVIAHAPEVSAEREAMPDRESATWFVFIGFVQDSSCIGSAEHLESQAECTLGIPCHGIDEFMNVSMQNKIKVDESTLFRSENCDISVDYHSPFYNYELGNIASGSFNYNEQLAEESEMKEVTYTYTNDASKSPDHDGGQMACNDILPEFEGFSIGFPPIAEECNINSDSPDLVEGRVSCHEQVRSFMHLGTPKSGLSRKYKINMLPDVFQSLPSEILDSMNLSNFLHFDGDSRQKLWRSQDACYCSLDSDFLGSSNSHGMCSPGARFGRELEKPPLTPLVEKSNIKMISGRSVGAVGSKPELVCFRIDENTSTSEENEFSDELGGSGKRTSSRDVNMSVNRKALFDITSSYGNVMNMAPITGKNMEISSLQSVDSKSCIGTQSITHFSVGTAYTSKKNQRVDMVDQDVLTDDGNKDHQASESLCKRSSKLKLNGKPIEKNKGSAVNGKGCKPRNVISNISSFIPLIPRKQQETPAKGKKDIKVKALGAAQAAKLLEEKKKYEREKRKEAAKLERLRLEEEKKLKQKQIEEEKQRKEADLAARKRQREAEDREKERKKRCIKESQKMQRQQEERPDTEIGGKEMRHKHADEDKQKLGWGQEAKHHFEQVIGENVTRIAEAAQMELSATEGIINLDSLRGINQDRMSTTEEIQDFQSYEMSPYRDSSDEEDGEDENFRARKHIPLWARKGHLEKALQSVQHLDPIEIFSQKNSFDLGEVLCPHVSCRPV